MRTLNLEIPPEVSEEKVLAFARCYQLETWLRELVYLELKAYYGSAWWTECEAAINRSGGGGMPWEKSRDRDHQHPHMATAENDPLWFLSFDALLKILLDEQLWPRFECYLTTKKLLDAKLDEVRLIRNRIAHARRLHDDDLDRLRRVLRDLDQGFWRFCTSYNRRYPLTEEIRKADAMFDTFLAEVGKAVVVSIEYVVRPSADYGEAMATGKGRLYCLVISTLPDDRRSYDYEEILKWTRAHHGSTAHIMMDSFQKWLTITFPAAQGSAVIIEAAREFVQACANCTTIAYRGVIDKQLQDAGITSPAERISQWEPFNRPFDDIAAKWPHYVVSPSHPFTFLYPDCPCSFFSV